MNATAETMYRCSRCHKVSTDKNIAERCCKPGKCRVCGKELEPYYLLCESCRNKENYEKAEKIKISDYKIECIFDPNYDKYFRDKEELEDFYECEENYELPEWVWGCEETPFEIDIDSAIENAEESMYEDFDDIVDEKELRDFIKVWNNKQTAKAYYPDRKTIVLLNNQAS